MNRTRGVSLVETLVVMAVGSIVAALSINILHDSQQNARDAENWLALQRGVGKWETQLRADLRGATSVQLPDEKTLIVESDTSRVTYAILENRVERTHMEGDQKVSTEGYLFPKCQVTITMPENDSVWVEIDPLQRTKSVRTFNIRQSVGRR